MPAPDPRTADSAASRVVRAGWLTLGLLCVALAVIGAIVPLMPTTIFLILAAACFARSAPRLEAWLLRHKRFGPTLVAWRAEGAISRSGKIAACAGIAFGFALFLAGAHPGWRLSALVAAILAACAAYIVTRPSPGTAR